jgi:heme A synthase
VLGLICSGGLVTSHEAGMAVPDWPNSFGYNMFLFPISRWVGGVFFEHTHVLGGALMLMIGVLLSVALSRILAGNDDGTAGGARVYPMDIGKI